MNKLIGFVGFLLLLASCNDDLIEDKDLTPYDDWIKIEASSTTLPFNEYGVAYLRSFTDHGGDVTDQTIFYIDGVKVEGNKFVPKAIGNYAVNGVFKDLESTPVEIQVQVPLNKKVLIESFTSTTCGWCPWIGSRVDSLHNANPKVISYTIHGQDELEFAEVGGFEKYMNVYGRPTIRVNRESLDNFAAQIQINGLVDSINYYLSSQPSLELSIQSTLSKESLSVEVSGKFYTKNQNDLYLTVILVEDGLFTTNQDNFFSGGSYQDCPYVDKPNPIPTYENHNVLRKFLTDINGDAINSSNLEDGQEQSIATIHLPIDQVDLKSIANSYIIAFIHERKADVTVASVINTQIVSIGESVGFKE